MPNIFHSATVKLTGWYLLILMSLSVMFSVIIYHVSIGEIDSRLHGFQSIVRETRGYDLAPPQIKAAISAKMESESDKLAIDLLYLNIFVFFAGGIISYVLAKRSIAPIKKSHEAQARFTSDASHELRTPLAVMKTEMEVVLMDKEASKEELKQTITSSLEEVDKLTRLSQMLLNLSRYESSKLKMAKIDITKITKDVISSNKLDKKRVKLSGEKNLVGYGNETAIYELIKILVDNALKYSPERSIIDIHLSAEKAKGQAKFRISNGGKGIPKDKLQCIFERFYRADSSRTNSTQNGYGLGLAIAKQIVELHDGYITATSSPKITTFEFNINTSKKLSKN